MPEVVEWRDADRPALARRAADVLSGGGMVAFPTDTAYHLAVCGLSSEGVARLDGDGAPLVVGLRGPADVTDWAPQVRGAGRRLARRCWPGPVTLACAGAGDDGLSLRLSGAVRGRLGRDGELWLRSPAHEALLLTLERLAGPLVLAEVPAATSAGEALRGAGGRADLLIDDGPCPLAGPATVVRVEGAAWSVLVPGVVSEEVLAQMSPNTIVFLCTGNTCRSPLAEALCKKMLAERLGCAVEDLLQRGYRVLSAGIAASPGDAAAAEAAETAREHGADLTNHSSRRLNAELLAQTDHLIAMTQSHLRAVAPYCGGEGARARLLSRAGEDLDDPIGGDREVYRRCAGRIVQWLEELLPELQES